MEMILTLFAGLLLLVHPVHADFVAYTDTRDGTLPLPKNIDPIDAKHLVKVKWGAYHGNKTRVGVLPVQNNSTMTTMQVTGAGGYNVNYSASSGGIPMQGIEAILTDVMHRTGRFRIVERTVLDRALTEQDLGASGRMSKPSAAKVGKVLGAQYLVQAVVTHYEPNYEGQDIGVGGMAGSLLGGAGALLGAVKVKSSKSMVGMNFRLVNAETSEVVFTKQVESIIDESGLSLGGLGIGGGGALGGFMSSYSKTPIGQSVIAAVNKGVYELVKQAGSAPATGSVVKVSGKKIYLNLGKGQVEVGTHVRLFSKGEALIDPETGLSLGGEEEELGEAEITTAKKKYSIARPVSVDTSQIKTGDKAVSTAAAEPLQFASTWQAPQEGFFGKSNAASQGNANEDF